jgi:hypothetical protein
MKSTTQMIKASCAALLAFALIGCATKMSQEDRLALKRVSMGPIQMPEKPLVLTDGGAAGAVLGGPLGFALANAGNDAPTALKQHLSKNRIDVPAYVKRELVSQLKAKGIEVVDGTNQGNPVLVVQVLQYGLTGDVFSKDRWPQVWLRLSIVNEKGDRIWLGYAAAHGDQGVLKQVEKRPLADFFSDPALLDREFKKVTKMIVSSSTKDL